MDQLQKLSLGADGPNTLQTLQALHRELNSVLQQAERLSCSSDSSSPLATLQKLTGCSRKEAQYYLQQARFSLQNAVVQWHNQVLRDYLAAYQATFPGCISFRQHERREMAETMRSQAKKAAEAAAGFEASMAHNYLRTNFCAICKVERDAAETYMSATNGNIMAAVEEYIARHLQPPSEAADPDASLTETGALVSRSGSTDSACSVGSGGLGGGSAAGAAAGRQPAVYKLIGSLSAVDRDGSGDQPTGTLRSRYAAAAVSH